MDMTGQKVRRLAEVTKGVGRSILYVTATQSMMLSL